MAKPFTFRAQPALDLRQREFDARRRALATAEWDLSAARQIYEESVVSVSVAQARAGLAMQETGAIEAITWHRLWIARLERARGAHAVTVSQKQDEVARATEDCRVARQRMDAMTRLKEKAYETWDRAARLYEQRDIDALGTMRYVAASRAVATRSTP